ncbi:hypothetical protein G5I_11334 [Acromyrmex echinatior]|uniref:Uncharacterized protein n=1 Tax=Acromyrmex echinatior TaxID=103372 RepID=F4WZB9_ACREC|nr:hypothetical protein G5I_11334 [Acromyrmex echinatior]
MFEGWCTSTISTEHPHYPTENRFARNWGWGLVTIVPLISNSEELKTVRDKRPKMAQRDSPLKPFRKDTALAFVRRFIPHSSHGTAALPWTATPEKTATVTKRRPGISQESYKPADYNDGTIREEHSEKKVAGQPTGNRY